MWCKDQGHCKSCKEQAPRGEECFDISRRKARQGHHLSTLCVRYVVTVHHGAST